MGSLTKNEWNESLEMVMEILHKVHEKDNHDSLYWMNRVDRLLNRLLAEYATKSKPSRSRGNDLLDSQLLVLEAWCCVAVPESLLSSGNDDDGAVAVAVERATRVFWNIVQRSPKPWWRSEDKEESNKRTDILADSLSDLLSSVVTDRVFVSSDELNHIVRILLWKDLSYVFSQKEGQTRLFPIYARVMEHVQSNGDKRTLSLLDEQWKQISDKDIWQLIDPAPPSLEEESTKEQEAVTPTKNHDVDVDVYTTDSDRELSSFEIEQMVKKTIQLLETSESKDDSRIKTLIHRWDTLFVTGAVGQQSDTVVGAILDHCARTGDTGNGIKWLPRLNIDRASDVPKGLNPFIIALARDKDPTAIWRAEEIIRRLEKNDLGDALDSGVYAAVADRWLHTNESHAHRRVMELCFRPALFDPGLVSVLLQAIRREKEVSPNIVKSILEWYSTERTSLDDSIRRELLGGIFHALQRHGQGRAVWELIQAELDDGDTLVIDGTLCESVVASIPSNPDELMEIFSALESKGVELGARFFQSASRRLLDFHHGARLEHLNLLNKAVMKRVESGAIEQASIGLSEFFVNVFTLLSDWDQNDVAMDLLDKIEATMLSEGSKGQAVVSISCYSLTADILQRKRDLQRIENLYERLRSLFVRGFKELHPDNRFYMAYMRAVGESASANDDAASGLNKQKVLLRELQAHYESTGDDRFRALPGMFRNMLSMMVSKEATHELAEQSVIVLDDMIAADAVDTKDADPFSMAMHIVLRSPRRSEFRDIRAIRQQMKGCNVKESDLVFLNTLRACTRTNGNEEREEGVTLALEALTDFRRKCRGDQSPHGTRIYNLTVESVLRNLHQRDKRKYPILRKIFQCCIMDGYLNPEFIEKVRRNVSKNFFDELYSNHLTYGGVEPAEWSRNVKR